MPYKVIVADNFHYQDPDEEYEAGTFDTKEQALAAARTIVDTCLVGYLRDGLTSSEMYDLYTTFGYDPYIVVSGDMDPVSFSAWDYARSRVDDIIAASAAAASRED